MSPLSKSMHQRSVNDNIPVDERLKRLRDNILPESPYILTVPTTYHVSPHQHNDWRRGTPFGADEQKLQYLSFLSHTMDDTMLKAEGDWDDGNGGIADKSSQSVSTRRSSGTMSPLLGQDPRKKKMTLSDYKKKVAQGGMKTSPGSNPNLKPEEKVNGPTISAQKEVKPMEKIPQVQKRPFEAISQEKDANPTNRDQTPPPAKKARTSPSPPDTKLEEKKIEKPNAHGLPPLLSPTLPPIEKKIEKPANGLPPLLSPTLPPSIEKELAKLQASKRNENAEQKNAKKLQSQSPSILHGSQIASKDKLVVAKDSGLSPSSKDISSVRAVASPQKQLAPALDPKEKGSKANAIIGTKLLLNGASDSGIEISTVTCSKPSMENPVKESLLVKLKISKPNRKWYAAIIKFTPRPGLSKKPETSQQNNFEKTKNRTKEPIDRNGLEKTGEKSQQRKAQSEQFKDVPSKAGEKRRLESVNDPEPSAKRQKSSAAPALIHKPRTPVPNHKPRTPVRNRTPVRPIIKSPASSQSNSTQKPHLSTPKRILKGAAMQRITSQEADVQTPSGGTRGGTPTAPSSAERGNRDGRSISNPSVGESSVGNRGEAASSLAAASVNGINGAASWRDEQSKYLTLGRVLKHDADVFLKVGGEINTDPVEKEQGIAIAVETILCYMLGFMAGDEALRVKGRACDSGSWRSLLPYIQFVKSVVTHSHLRGLVMQLEAVCREIIHVYDIERLNREPLPSGPEEAHSNPTSNGADAAATTEQETNAKRRQYIEFKSKLVENVRLARQAWLQGNARLSVEKIRSSYPRTWEKRAAAPREEDAKEKLVVDQYNVGSFYLPLNSTSTGIEAVRLGWSFLKEWCVKDDVSWEGKMGL